MIGTARLISGILLASSGLAAEASTLAANEPHLLMLYCTGERVRTTSGTPYRPRSREAYAQVFYLDLAHRRYCEEDCRLARNLVPIGEDAFDLSHGSPAGLVLNTYGVRRRFDRRTSRLAGDEVYNAGSHRRFEVQAQCLVRPMVPTPIAEFLANASNR